MLRAWRRETSFLFKVIKFVILNMVEWVGKEIERTKGKE